LFKQHTGFLRKPLLLYSFAGISSPFPYVPEVVNALHREFSKDFAFLDIGRIQAHRIFDLLTFYDRAVGLIVSDSAPAHLAVASKVPTIWLTVNGWTGSTPRGNVALHVEYNDVPGRLPEILATVGKWRHTPVNAESRLQPV